VNVRTLTSHKTHNAKISSRREINSKHIWRFSHVRTDWQRIVAPEIWKIKVRHRILQKHISQAISLLCCPTNAVNVFPNGVRYRSGKHLHCFSGSGKSTRLLGKMDVGDQIQDVMGQPDMNSPVRNLVTWFSSLEAWVLPQPSLWEDTYMLW